MSVSSETIIRYLSIPSAGGGDYHPSKPEIAYISSETGVYQVYTKHLETGEVSRISQGDDRATNPVYLPNGELLYVTDAGGDEKYQFMVYDGEVSYRLTQSLDVKHNFAFKTDQAVYFSANREDRERLDVYRYLLPLKPGLQPELVMRAESGVPLVPRLASEDGNRLIISSAERNLKSNLLLYDLSKADITPVTERAFGDHNNRFEAVDFISDNEILLLSDHGREFMGLAIFKLDSGALIWLEEDEFDTEQAELFGDNQILFNKNVKGSDRLFQARLLKDRIDDIREIPLPDEFAVLVSGDFRSFIKSFVVNELGSRALFTYSSPTAPVTLMEVDLTVNQLSSVLEPAGFEEFSFAAATLCQFQSFDGLTVPYYLYSPSGEGPFPAVFLIHGGPEGQSRPAFNNQVQLLVSQGYLVVVPNIRGSNGYGRSYLALDDVEKRLDSIRDINSLAEHLKSTETRLDKDRLVVFGGSYGGFAVLSCITEFPEQFAAAVDVVGISNFVTFLSNTASWRRRLREAEYGSLEHDEAFLESVSPINKVDRIQTPLLIVQGRNDERVPLSESEQMYEALRGRNVPCELLIFDDEGHGVVKKVNQVVEFSAMLEFLEKHLP